VSAGPHSLGRNVVRSFAGQVAPGLAAIVALPILLRGLGADGLGILHLTWAVVGYFSLLDVGVGRALTQAVAAGLARRDATGVGGVAFTGCVALTILGAAGGAVLWPAGPPCRSSGCRRRCTTRR
jgi:O-antigen/teichoic acid export membrane protein